MEGRQLLLLVTAIAVGLLILSRASLLIAPLIIPESVLAFVRQVWDAIVSPFEVPALSTYFGAFLWGPALALLVNMFYGAEKASTRVIKRYGAEREKLLFVAMEEEALVSVTLSNRKVYVGWPVYTPDLRRETRDFRLLPAVSGYRDEKTLELWFTTQYIGIYQRLGGGAFEGLSAEDFEVAIPLDEVTSVGQFSLAIDQDLFKIPSEDDASEDDASEQQGEAPEQ